MTQTPVPAPTPPPARRLSRLALSAVLLLAGLFIAVAALVVTAPRQKNPLRPDGPQDQRPAEATFLNNPPRRQGTPGSAPDPRIAELLAAARRPQPGPSGPLALGAPPEDSTSLAPETRSAALRPSQSSSTSASASDTEPPLGAYRPYPSSSRPAFAAPAERTPSWQAAFNSSLTPSSKAAAPPSIPLPPPPTPSAPPGLPSPPPQTGPVPAPTPQRSAVSPAPRTAGPRTLRAGSVLDALLLTAIHSDSAGDTVAHVTHDVYSVDGSLLLPRGTRLIGSYQNQVSLGQNRLAIAWDRLLLLDGRSYDLPGLPTTSPDGAAGLPGSVNHHTGLVFGRAALLSLVSAGAQLGQPRQSRLSASLSDRELVAGSVAQQLSQAATEYLSQAIRVAPTLTIPAGSRLTVLLPFDLQLSPR